MFKRIFRADGHLIDSGILASILNLIVQEEGDYRILDFEIGRTNLDESRIEIELLAPTEEKRARITSLLVQHGCYEKRTFFSLSCRQKVNFS